MELARDVGLKRVYAFRIGDVRAKCICLDVVDDVYLKDILVQAGDEGFDSLAGEVLQMYKSGAVDVKGLPMGFCRRLAVGNVAVAQDAEVDRLRSLNEELEQCNAQAWGKVMHLQKELETK